MLRVWALRLIRLSFFVFCLNAFFLLAVKVGFRVWGSGVQGWGSLGVSTHTLAQRLAWLFRVKGYGVYGSGFGVI